MTASNTTLYIRFASLFRSSPAKDAAGRDGIRASMVRRGASGCNPAAASHGGKAAGRPAATAEPGIRPRQGADGLPGLAGASRIVAQTTGHLSPRAQAMI